jgi:hypothetical protein
MTTQLFVAFLVDQAGLPNNDERLLQVQKEITKISKQGRSTKRRAAQRSRSAAMHKAGNKAEDEHSIAGESVPGKICKRPEV